MVRGKKSVPSRTSLAPLAVARTWVSPMRATTAPCDWGASTPVEMVRVLSVPETGPDTEMASAMMCLLLEHRAPVKAIRVASSQSVISRRRPGVRGPSELRLTTDRRWTAWFGVL